MNYRIDLLPAELRQRRTAGLRRAALFLLVIVALAGFTTGYRLFQARCAQVAGELAALNESLPSLRMQAARLEEIRGQRRDLEKKNGELTARLENRRPWPELLAGVAGAVPGEVWLTGLRAEAALEKGGPQAPEKAPQPAQGQGVEPGTGPGLNSSPRTAFAPTPLSSVPDTLIIEGASRSAPAVGMFISRLARLPYFSNVMLTGLHFDEGEGCLVFTAAASLRTGASGGEQVK